MASIQNRWQEHFDELLNRDVTVYPSALDELEQFPVVQELSCEPTSDEVNSAIKQLKNNKSARPDKRPPKAIKYCGETLALHVHSLLVKVW